MNTDQEVGGLTGGKRKPRRYEVPCKAYEGTAKGYAGVYAVAIE